MSRNPGAEVVDTHEFELNGRTYRKRTFASGSTSTEPVATLGDKLQAAGAIGLLLTAFIVLTAVWILGAHALLGSKLPLAALIPTHIVAALVIGWAAILFGGFSESKRVTVSIILVGAPLATVFILGVANFF